jgi:hypothetical protein
MRVESAVAPGVGAAVKFLAMRPILAFTVLFLLPAALSAQWPPYLRADVPRTADGKPDLNAPVPRLANGKPDFSGTWESRVGPSGRLGGPFLPSLTPDSPPVATFFDAGRNMKGGLPYTPWAAELRKQRMARFSQDNPDAQCLPMGFLQTHTHSQPRRVVHTKDDLIIMYEANQGLRQIFTDGRTLPSDPNPQWEGYSIGRWDGDTLVVETVGFNGQTWFDHVGNHHSDALRVLERFTRTADDVITYEATITDPKTFSRPWTMRMPIYRLRDRDRILENECYLYAEDAGKPIRGQHPK